MGKLNCNEAFYQNLHISLHLQYIYPDVVGKDGFLLVENPSESSNAEFTMNRTNLNTF